MCHLRVFLIAASFLLSLSFLVFDNSLAFAELVQPTNAQAHSTDKAAFRSLDSLKEQKIEKSFSAFSNEEDVPRKDAAEDQEECIFGEPTGEAFTDNNGITWNRIPAGCFEMGCSPEDDRCFFEELPRHRVRLTSFWMMETEITQDDYQFVTGSNPSYYQGCPDCPVDMISMLDSGDFCESIGGRLPTEAEWEYAARAGTTTRYYCGDDSECLNNVAWWVENAGGRTHPVRQKLPNAYGLYDILGNVTEWVNDFYFADYYRFSPEDDPQGPDFVPGAQPLISFRGGHYNLGLIEHRASSRHWDPPDHAGETHGARCVMD